MEKEKEACEFNWKDIFSSRKYIDVGILLLAILLGIYLNWDMLYVLIFGVFIWTIINPISSRYLAMVALFFLAVTPLLLIMRRDVQAEQYAVFAYFFLAMSVFMGIYEIRKEENFSLKKNK